MEYRQLHRIHINPDGSIWVCDAQAHVARKLDPDGRVMMTLGNYDKPSDNGYNPSLPFAESYRSIVRTAPPFNRPTSIIETPDGHLYATDGYGNTAIHRFCADGTLEKTWESLGENQSNLSGLMASA